MITTVCQKMSAIVHKALQSGEIYVSLLIDRLVFAVVDYRGRKDGTREC